nr:uncharacterized protein LOC104101983 [Nicotiana tomentosiformis]
MSQPQLQLRGNTRSSLYTGELTNPCQEPIETGQISSNPRQRPSVETVSSRNLDRNAYPSLEAESGSAISSRNKKRGRGKYKSKTVDIKTKYGGKITIMIPDDIDRVVGDGKRDIGNYCGLIMRSTISFRDGNWQKIVSKYGETMWLKVKDKFEVLGSVREHVLQAFVISTMQWLFRAWKARLSSHYSRHIADGNILSHRPEDVELEDWKYLVEYFESSEFKVVSERNRKNSEKQITKHACGTRSFVKVEESMKNPATGEKERPDQVWEIQHTRKDDNGEIGQLQELVAQQQSEENEHLMTRDEILSSVLGERIGYVRGKGYGKKPPKKSHFEAANLEASVSSAMATVRQEMQEECKLR